MGKLTPEQLQVIGKLNNLPKDPQCQRGCMESCWLATEAAANALKGLFTMPEGYAGCKNEMVVSMVLVTLSEMSQGTKE